MDNLPDPLTPSTLDLRSFTYMPLEVVRLRDSDLVVLASGEEFRAAVLLWCAAWHQVPSASLPNDERMLANLAGFGRDLKAWREVSEAALRGFIECNDGRLYHPVIAEKAIESGSKKKKQSSQTAAATEARRSAKVLRDESEMVAERERYGDVTTNVTLNVTSEKIERNVVQGIGEERKGEDLKKDSPPVAKATRVNVKFEEFWEARPMRDGEDPRKPAEKKFNALVKTGVDPDVMIAGAKSAANAAKDRGIFGTRFVPQTVKWLNDQRFADYAAAAFVIDKPVKGYYAKADSEQLEAWDEHNRASKGIGLPRDVKGGWLCPAEWPPDYVKPDRSFAVPESVLKMMGIAPVSKENAA